MANHVHIALLIYNNYRAESSYEFQVQGHARVSISNLCSRQTRMKFKFPHRLMTVTATDELEYKLP